MDRILETDDRRGDDVELLPPDGAEDHSVGIWSEMSDAGDPPSDDFDDFDENDFDDDFDDDFEEEIGDDDELGGDDEDLDDVDFDDDELDEDELTEDFDEDEEPAGGELIDDDPVELADEE